MNKRQAKKMNNKPANMREIIHMKLLINDDDRYNPVIKLKSCRAFRKQAKYYWEKYNVRTSCSV